MKGMKFADHCRESIEKMGKPFAEVHEWLDAFAGTRDCGMRHRRKRHHLRGIEEVRNLWGNDAAEAARLHIMADLREEGWRETDGIPMDEEEYVRRGLY